MPGHMEWYAGIITTLLTYIFVQLYYVKYVYTYVRMYTSIKCINYIYSLNHLKLLLHINQDLADKYQELILDYE